MDLVPAGRQGPAYAARVNSFNWQSFYDRLGGGVFLEAVKQVMRTHYDYILIDSRTGVSDTSGICTVQMPDALVVFYTANTQSIEGAAAVAASVQERWSAFEQGKATTDTLSRRRRILPVFTRVELGEKDKLQAARDYARPCFRVFLEHLRLNAIDEYWRQVETLYVPWYAYEEVLAPFGDKPKEANSLLAAAERLTAYLTNGKVTELADPPSEADRLKVRGQFTRTEATPSRQYDVYISYDSSDKERVAGDLLPRLEGAGLRVLVDYRDFRAGAPVVAEWERAVENSRHTLLMLTPAWIKSTWPAFLPSFIASIDPTGRSAQTRASVVGEVFDSRRSRLPLLRRPY